MISHVVDRRRGDDDVRPRAADGFRHPPPARVVHHDCQVTELKAHVVGPEHVRGRLRFVAADVRNFGLRKFGAPQVAGRHGGDRDVAALLLQEGERPGDLELDVVRMGVNRENSRQG